MSGMWEYECIKYRGVVLEGKYTHWCFEGDGLPIDETCGEWPCCGVAYRLLPRKLKKWAISGFARRNLRSTVRLRRRFNRVSIARRSG